MHNIMKKTKIVCTLGPAVDDEIILRQMILEGMNIARFNMSHGSHDLSGGGENRILRIELPYVFEKTF